MQTADHHINIARDYSEVPSGRYVDDGPWSGEAFRERILKPALDSYDRIVIELDGAEGYGSSFLEEAFGGLVRKGYLTKQAALSRIEIVAQSSAYQHYRDAILRYLDRAKVEN